jgi:hypothetical protein
VQCPSCMEPCTRLVYQQDSQDLLDWTWGDLGVGMVLQCDQHPTSMAFTWVNERS